jgi:hypothetical protein
MQVTEAVDGYKVRAIEKETKRASWILKKKNIRLFLLTHGYGQNEFEEYHYKMPITGTDKSAAIQKRPKESAFIGIPVSKVLTRAIR